MIKHLLNSTFRNFWRYKTAFSVNLLSLTMGLSVTIITSLWIWDEWQVDRFHQNNDRLYQVMYHYQNDEGIRTSPHMPGPMGSALQEDVPEIEHAVTVVDWMGGSFSAHGHAYQGKGYYATAGFFELFSFPIIAGNPAALLSSEEQVVVSNRIAEYFFEDAEKAIGQAIKFNDEEKLIIAGVFEDLPNQSTMQFDFVLPYERFTSMPRNQWALSWTNQGPTIFLLIDQIRDQQMVNTKINQVYLNHIEEEESDFDFFTKPFSERHLYGKYENGILAGGRIEYLWLFGGMALLILIMGAINYVNLSTARGQQRAIEVGVRKTIGASKRNLIQHYLFEVFVVLILSFVVALLLVKGFLPQINQLTGKVLTLSFNPGFWFFFVGLLLVLVLLAGLYPAFFLSGFQPVQVLKGGFSKKKSGLFLRQGLVILQFTIAFIFIVGVLSIYHQIHFLQTRDLGFAKDQLVEVIMDVKDREKIKTFLAEARQLEGIEAISSGNIPIDLQNGTTAVSWPGKDPEKEVRFGLYNAHDGLLETMNLTMVEGRPFSSEYGEEHRKVILNEKAVNAIGLLNPIGQTVELFESVDLEIIGVVKDFHYQSMYDEIQPLMFRWMRRPSPQLIARLDAQNIQTGLQNLKTLFETFNPMIPFQYAFLNQKNEALYAAEDQLGTLSKYLAGIAIFIAILGLFGLVTYMVQVKTKEIGIRKVLGAETLNIVRLFSASFIKLVLVVVFMGTPIAWYLVTQWLYDFAYHFEFGMELFVLALLGLLLMTFLTVSIQSLKAALANPVDSLRNE